MRKLNVTIVAGLVVALIGAALVVVYGRGVDERIADGQRLVPVLVATADIAAGADGPTVLAASEIEMVPEAYVVEQPLGEIDPAETDVLKGFVSVGSQLSENDFGPPVTAASVTPAEGRVNIAVEVGLTPGVARYITPGSTVDMFVTFQSGTTGPDSLAVTRLFATAVPVVSVSIAQPAAVEGEDAQNGEQVGADQVLVLLDVTPDLAEIIVNATELGSIYLALSAGEPHVGTSGTTPVDLLLRGPQVGTP